MRQTTRRLIIQLLMATGVALGVAMAARFMVVSGRLDSVGEIVRYGLVVLTLGVAGLGSFISYYEYHGIGCQAGVFRRGPHSHLASITFDDGPSATYTPQILDVLKDKGVKATFFVVGDHVRKYPDVARRIVAEGHDIGNHTYSHRDLVGVTRQLVLNQLGAADKAIREVTGAETSLFRPPRGLFSQAVRGVVVDELGYQIVMWTVSSLDWRSPSPARIARRVRHHIRPGGIVLFHDSGSWIRREGGTRANTVAALPVVIDELRASGYRLLPVSELMAMSERMVVSERVDDVVQPASTPPPAAVGAETDEATL